MFYNKPVAIPTENKQHSQGIQILLNQDLFPNNALSDMYPQTFKVIIA